MSAFQSPIGSPKTHESWAIETESFVVEETPFECSGEKEPLKPDRVTAFALETWNLKKTVLDLNSQILKIKSELKTHKNLSRNLQQINSSVTKDNVTKTKENQSLKLNAASQEKQIKTLSEQISSLNTNLSRQKKTTYSCQTRLHEMERAADAFKQEKNSEITALKAELLAAVSSAAEEKSRADAEISRLANEQEQLQSIVHDSTSRVEDLSSKNTELTEKVARLEDQVKTSADLLSRELESVYDLMHRKLEAAHAEKEEIQIQLLKAEYEKDHMLRYLLGEGLQLPKLAPFNVTQARNKLKASIEAGIDKQN